MSTQDDDQQSQGVVWAVLIGVVLLAVSLAIGMGLYRTSRGAAMAPAAATTGAPMAPAPVSGSGGGFSPGVAAAGAGIGAAVADGDPAKNEELAKQRALRVRDALTALGIGEDKLDLRKPAVTTADGSNAEARRVEVTLE